MCIPVHTIFRRGAGPTVAAAVHHGHLVRDNLLNVMALSELDRLREEDPYTGAWTQAANTQIVGIRSRFEVDLNRPRLQAVYRTPSDAWGLTVWREPLTELLIAESLDAYDTFYRDVHHLLQSLLTEHPRVVVLDLHTYNHRRNGSVAPAANAVANPEVNVGTGTIDRTFWGPVVARCIDEIRHQEFCGRRLDVRENVKFQGGYFGRWINEHFPRQVCAIAIEFKKFFMDEWSGEVDLRQVDAIYHLLAHAIPGVEAQLGVL